MRLEELCARSEQCSGEVREKLRRWEIGDRDAEAILKSLISRRFVDDSRFAGAFVRDKYRYGKWGRRKIAAALYAKRVDRDIIDSALADIDEEEYEAVLRALLKLKIKTTGPLDVYENRMRLLRFAVGRGFEPQLVSRLLAQLQKNH